MDKKVQQADLDQVDFSLESDARLNPVIRSIMRNMRGRVVEHQQGQQRIVENFFKDDKTINIFSIVRDPTAKGGESLEEKLSQNKPRVIVLLNGIVNPQDIVQVSSFLERYGMKVLRLRQSVREKVSRVTDDTELGDTIPGYICKTVKTVQKELFRGEECDVVVVRNASKQDLLDVARKGGENTVLVVGGHGTLGSLSMTDGKVQNTEIPTPEKPLKAFVQHTCASPKGEKEKMGSRWASTVFGWEKGVSPVDFIDNPLVPRGS